MRFPWVLTICVAAASIFASSPSSADHLYVGSTTITDVRLHRVDVATGNRTIISSNTVGTGPTFPVISSLTKETDSSLLVHSFVPAPSMEQTGREDVLRVDTATGNRTNLFYRELPYEFLPAPRYPSNVVLSTNLWYALAGSLVPLKLDGSNTLDPIQVITGGSGMTPKLAVEPAGTFLVYNNSTGEIRRKTLDNSTLSVVSSATVGTGPALSQVAALAVASADKALVLQGADSTFAVLEIDLATGNRTVISSSTVGTGPIPGFWPGEMAVASDGTIYISDMFSMQIGATATGTIFRVDPATGNRTVVSNATTGSGENFGESMNVLGPIGLVLIEEETTGIEDWQTY